MNSKQVSTIIAVILALLLLICAWWAYSTNQSKNQLIKENEKITGDLQEMEDLRAQLASEVDSLQNAYSDLALENEALQGSLAEAQQTVAEKEAAVRNEKTRSNSEINNLRAEIQRLIELKTQLEGNISALQSENDSLKVVTGTLEVDLGAARAENEALSNLNRSIQDEVNRLTLSNFKASAFQVDIEQNKEKVTAKARRARKIKVSFDLTDVPAQYQGLKTLYLTIADEKGTPIKALNPIKAQTVVNNQTMDIIAVKATDVDITANQRLSFTYDLEEKLDAGYYRVAIFTDIGMLGASSVRLR
ncbi:MAG TPA: hypothetical protein PKA00_22365 [Saprospiraceae bacterium]|nr:hypothetical protein [Saprospiraceae bacterium]HMQ85673.1 hypothetical protein [Saprospiraceae bacterium]